MNEPLMIANRIAEIEGMISDRVEVLSGLVRPYDKVDIFKTQREIEILRRQRELAIQDWERWTGEKWGEVPF